jgi:Tol biopolymer transport system component
MKKLLLLQFVFLFFGVSAQIPLRTDIFLAECNLESTNPQIKTPLNITNRLGYDNQPEFFENGKSIYYVSIREDEQADIYKYSLSTKSTSQITRTTESEYSPKMSNKGTIFSVVRVERDSSQRFQQYDLQGLKNNPLCYSIDSIGYYCWKNEKDFVFFKITNPPSLWKADLTSCSETKLTTNCGRCLIPKGENEIYFTQLFDTVRWICTLNFKTNQIEKLIECLQNAEDFAFYKTSKFIMANNSKLYTFDLNQNRKWTEIANFELNGISNIKRISISKDLGKIAFVADYNQP